jgi:dihydroxy-acid dehydratase
MIVIDIEKRRLDVELPEQELKDRLTRWTAPSPRYKSGVFHKYSCLVSSASDGAIMKA